MRAVRSGCGPLATDNEILFAHVRVGCARPSTTWIHFAGETEGCQRGLSHSLCSVSCHCRAKVLLSHLYHLIDQLQHEITASQFHPTHQFSVKQQAHPTVCVTLCTAADGTSQQAPNQCLPTSCKRQLQLTAGRPGVFKGLSTESGPVCFIFLIFLTSSRTSPYLAPAPVLTAQVLTVTLSGNSVCVTL